MTAHIAYYRVSTERQGRSGLGLEAQRAAVARYQPIAEYTEVESGKRNDRPQLAAALAHCRKVRATLVIAKIDRLARNMAFIANLMDSGVDFIAADMPEANRLTIHIMAAMAEHEAKAISDRTKAALAAAKARGQQLGWANPARHDQAQASQTAVTANVLAADAFAEEIIPTIEHLRRQGIHTYRALAAALNARGAKTRNGGPWYASTVRAVVQRATPQPAPAAT